jgi:hypothetical protein
MEQIPFYQRNKLQDKIFELMGIAGTMVLLFMLSFDWYWNKFQVTDSKMIEKEMIPVMFLSLFALVLLYKKYKGKSIVSIRPIDLVFGLFIPIYIAGGVIPSLGMICINSMLLFLSVSTILSGLKSNHIGTLNIGLLVIAVLIACRFFDTDLSFVTRGLLFVGAGLGFFILNYRMLKSRNNED